MSNRRAQDERIEGTPDGANAITEITDIPDAPTIGTATAGIGNVSVAFTPATTGGTASTFTATSNPGSITGTSATSPITVSGLTAGTSYTFTVRGSNSTGTGAASSASNSVTPSDLVNGYDALASVTLSTTTSSITFSGIPQGYSNLQIRALTRDNRGAEYLYNTYIMQFNDDSTNSYSSHAVYGQSVSGSSPIVDYFGNASQSRIITYATPVNIATSQIFGSQIIDILDYTDTDKYKTTRLLGGVDENASGLIGFMSGAWYKKDAINSITLSGNGASFVANSEFSLYGVK